MHDREVTVKEKGEVFVVTLTGKTDHEGNKEVTTNNYTIGEAKSLLIELGAYFP